MAINPLLLPLGMTAGIAAGAQQQPQQPVTPQMQAPQMQAAQPQSNDFAQMLRVIGGDLSGSLSTGDKLLALSGLLRSATRSGRRAGLTPQQVIGDLQQRKLAELQGRMQVEQLRTAEAQRQQQIASTIAFAETLPEDQREAFLGLPLEQRLSRMEQEAFRQRQWVGTFVDAQGRTLNRFLDGRTELAGYDLPPELEIDTYDHDGDNVASRVTRNKVTGEIIRVDPLGRTPAEIADDVRAQEGLAIRRQEANRPRSAGRTPQPRKILFNGEEAYGIPLGGYRYQLQDGRTVNATPVSSSDDVLKEAFSEQLELLRQAREDG